MRQRSYGLKKDLADFFREHADEAQQLECSRNCGGTPRKEAGGAEAVEFLPWFEEWFLKRAKSVDRAVEA